MNEDILKQIIIDTIKGERHLGENLKEQCVNYIEQLQNNWNELKKWCKETIETVECTDLSEDYLMGCEDILKKMQELEKKQ